MAAQLRSEGGSKAATRWILPGLTAGIVFAMWAMMVGLFTSTLWRRPRASHPVSWDRGPGTQLPGGPVLARDHGPHDELDHHRDRLHRDRQGGAPSGGGGGHCRHDVEPDRVRGNVLGAPPWRARLNQRILPVRQPGVVLDCGASHVWSRSRRRAGLRATAPLRSGAGRSACSWLTSWLCPNRSILHRGPGVTSRVSAFFRRTRPPAGGCRPGRRSC